MSTVTIKTTIGITPDDTATITVSGEDVDLDVVQLRILSAVIWLVDFINFHTNEDDYGEPDDCHFIVKGKTLHEVFCPALYRRQISWSGDQNSGLGIAMSDITYIHNGKTIDYTAVHRKGMVTVIANDACRNAMTFKQGLLHSFDDVNAVVINFPGKTSKQTPLTKDDRMWFHEGRCHRAANPLQPSAIILGKCYHHDHNGKLHQDPALGPAVYDQSSDWVHTRTDKKYYVHGVEVATPEDSEDEHGETEDGHPALPAISEPAEHDLPNSLKHADVHVTTVEDVD
jgi:hypothetical protein